jgi:uncharacterized repeat protein (TIGR02543 family)
MEISEHPTVNISRVHFTKGYANDGAGGAIVNRFGTLILKSCIFSNNRVATDGDYLGAAICNTGSGSILSVTGCTFYNNIASNGVGDIGIGYGTVTLTGNLFYGNSTVYARVLYNMYGTITSSYNVYDTEENYNFAFGSTDKLVTTLSIDPTFFYPVTTDLNTLPTELPYVYPAVDFYGSSIVGGGAAGAVIHRSDVYYLTINALGTDAGTGEVVVKSGEVSASATAKGAVIVLQAVPDYGVRFNYWLVNDVLQPRTGDTLQLTMDGNKVVTAVFGLTDYYFITFDANGGTVFPLNKKVAGEKAVGVLPVPRRSFYTFASWNTAPDGSGATYTAVTTMPANAITLYAQWTEGGPEDVSTGISTLAALTLYPNPTAGVVYLDNPDGEAVYVYDLRGVVVLSVAAPAGDVIDLSRLSAGVYIVRVWEKVGKVVKR